MFSTVFIEMQLIFVQLGLENYGKTIREPPFYYLREGKLLNMFFTINWSNLKMLNTSKGLFWENAFIPCPASDIWRRLVTSLSNFSVILRLNCCFKPLNLDFTKDDHSWSCYIHIFLQLLAYYVIHRRHFSVMLNVILLFFSNLITKLWSMPLICFFSCFFKLIII